MSKFYPNIYKKNIFDINFSFLKEKNIKLLLFDLDNTIALIDQNKVDDDVVKLFNSLRNDFSLVIISNNTNKDRVKYYADILGTDFVYNAMKPLLGKYKKLLKKYELKSNEICVIGDQIVTDIFAGNRLGTLTILVDPMGVKDLKITSFNRFIERRILNHFKKKNIFKKGCYYE